MDFKKTLGKTYKFYGVHDNSFKIGPYIFEAVEDPDDGYRSYMTCIESRKDENLVFLGRSFARVLVEEYSVQEFEGFQLVDVDTEHVWLRFGTDHCDDYYPCFVFQYQTPRQLEVTSEVQTTRRNLPNGWFYDQELKNLNLAVVECLNKGDYDAAEKILKVLRETAKKAKTRH